VQRSALAGRETSSSGEVSRQLTLTSAATGLGLALRDGPACLGLALCAGPACARTQFLHGQTQDLAEPDHANALAGLWHNKPFS
jgi:hypothetical protein